MSPLVPADQIQSRILVLRGQRVLLDSDLAALYGVPAKQLNQAVKRNIERFPDDFCFQLDHVEMVQLMRSRSQSVTLKRGQNTKYLPTVFTEHGALQAANILRSKRAVEMSVQVVRAFVQLRQTFATHRALASKLDELDARVGEHDDQLSALIETIRLLTTPDVPTHGRKIGFNQ